MQTITEALKTFSTKEDLVSIFLKNGIRLFGQIEAFDDTVLLLRNQTTLQMVYQHHIATVLDHLAAEQFKINKTI